MSNVDIGRYGKRIVQMIWDPEPRNDDPTHFPIWCLGRQYDATSLSSRPVESSPAIPPSSPAVVNGVHKVNGVKGTDSRPALQSRATSSGFEHVEKQDIAVAVNGAANDWPADFLDDFESRILFTYRSNFPPILKSEDPKAASAMSFSVRLKSQLSNQGGFTSDTGWGCMIRSGQSLLANALAMQRLGRDSRTSFDTADHKQLLSLFADDPQAPFSIHKFVEHGAAACGTYPGQWFGPSATARCIQALCNTYQDSGLKVYMTGDGPEVYEDTLFSIAKDGEGIFHPTLLLVATRLGIDKVTPVYRDALHASLTMPQSVGIAGGRPSSSHYFVGAQGSNFFYLDPHQTKPALSYHEDVQAYTQDEINTCHTRRLRRLSVDDMDPSMLIGYLFADEDDWRAWRSSIKEAPGKHILHVADTQPSSYGEMGFERQGALDEVETLDDEDDDE